MVSCMMLLTQMSTASQREVVYVVCLECWNDRGTSSLFCSRELESDKIYGSVFRVAIACWQSTRLARTQALLIIQVFKVSR